MSCSCNKNKVFYFNNKKYVDDDFSTKPFESCLFCTFKHLTLSYIIRNDKFRQIGQLYLAYRHINNIEIANKIIDIINCTKLNSYQIYNVILEVQQLLNDQKVIQNKQINLDDKINDKFTVYICSANQLYNHQLGYKDTNYPFVLGLLQLAVQNAPNEQTALKVRNIWKTIQDKQQINILDILI